MAKKQKLTEAERLECERRDDEAFNGGGVAVAEPTAGASRMAEIFNRFTGGNFVAQGNVVIEAEPETATPVEEEMTGAEMYANNAGVEKPAIVPPIKPVIEATQDKAQDEKLVPSETPAEREPKDGGYILTVEIQTICNELKEANEQFDKIVKGVKNASKKCKEMKFPSIIKRGEMCEKLLAEFGKQGQKTGERGYKQCLKDTNTAPQTARNYRFAYYVAKTFPLCTEVVNKDLTRLYDMGQWLQVDPTRTPEQMEPKAKTGKEPDLNLDGGEVRVFVDPNCAFAKDKTFIPKLQAWLNAWEHE